MHGVFLWNPKGVYLKEKAVKVYARESAAKRLADKNRYLPAIAVGGGFTFEDLIFKGLALGAPYVKMIGMARAGGPERKRLAMYGKFKDHLAAELKKIDELGLYKRERILTTPQGVEIRTDTGARVLNFCANNYLGLCNEPRVMAGANHAFFRWGFGMASVRFICGTQKLHKDLERRMAEFLGMDDAILYSSAFDANGGVFEPLLDEHCAIISDELNHASIIDGVRLARAKRFV